VEISIHPFAISALKQRGETQFCILSESSATRKLWQKSRWVPVLDFAGKIAAITLLFWKKGVRFDAEHLKQRSSLSVWSRLESTKP